MWFSLPTKDLGFRLGLSVTTLPCLLLGLVQGTVLKHAVFA